MGKEVWLDMSPANGARGAERRITRRDRDMLQALYDTEVFIDGKEFRLGNFEGRELAFIEDYCGRPLAEAFQNPLANPRLMIALVTVGRQRKRSTFTVNEAETLTFEELAEAVLPPAEEKAGAKSR